MHALRTQPTATVLCLVSLLAATAGCSRQWHAETADRQVYGLLRSAQQKEMGYPRTFSIDDSPSRNVERTALEILGPLPEAEALPEWLADSGLARSKTPLKEIDLAAALRLAQHNSRQFQNERETLYLTALALTTEIHAFEFQYGMDGSVMRTVDGEDRDRSMDTTADFSLTRELTTGALIALDVGLTGVKYLNHELGTTLQTALGLSVSQPLWGGASRTVVMNDLTQARRDVVYALRDFARYEKEFAVDVASSYYTVLVQLDRVKNEWENHKNLTAARERNELRFEAGELRRLEIDQARQSELRAQNTYLTAVQAYERQLDAFRISLGLPVDAPVVLAQKDLRALAASGILSLRIDGEKAVEAALAERLDLKNSRGAVEDADREVFVAADALKGTVDFVAGMNVTSEPDARAGRLMFHQGLYEFGLEVDLPLERLAERNSFRSSLITYDAAVRDYMDQVDGIKQDIRDSLRQLNRTEQTYRIAEASVKLAEQRVSTTRLEQDAGRAIMRDLLEAQESLVTAQNDRTQALVSHLVARLEFQRDMELLEVDEEGQIHEADIGPNLAPDGGAEPADDRRP